MPTTLRLRLVSMETAVRSSRTGLPLIRAASWCVCAILIALTSTPAPTRVAAATPNYIVAENAKPGTSEWKLTNPGHNLGIIEGYASATSVNRGGQIRLYVNTKEPAYSIDIYRMGYYQGLWGRRMLPTITRPGTAQPACPTDATTGLIECHWSNPYVLNIAGDSADPTVWMSGFYLVKLTAATSGKQQYIIFVVRDDARFTDVLMQQSVSTYQAYNVWGGKSLYGTIANRGDTANKANKVSFDRPYYSDSSNGQGQFFDATYSGQEFNMVQWLEKEGYDVSYATSVDVDANPSLLLNHRAFLSVGHDEYWSWRMRDHVEQARDAGVSLGFFSGNTSYWQVRFEPGVVNPEPSRVMVGYKEFWRDDPITPDYYKTNRFRENPVNRSEDAMLGVRYATQARPPFVVEDASHWVFTGTGLKNGDVLLRADGTPFLGYEVDEMGPGSPANTQRMAHSPARSRAANFADMTVYRAPSGATVFATGSIGWSNAVPQIQQITRNVLARLISNAFPDGVPIRPPLPNPFQATDIGNVGRAGFVSLAGNTSFTLNGAGTTSPFAGQDGMFFAYQPLNGDGQIIARLKSLQNFWDNRAGVMIRESLSPAAKSVSLLGRPSESAGVINEGAELRVKDVVGGRLTKIASLDLNLPNWLKLVRSGTTFSSYLSADGTTWTLVGSASVPMGSTAYIGAMVASSRHGVWATAVFDNVSIGGAEPPTPTLTAIVVSPPTASLAVGGTQTFTARGLDQSGNPFPTAVTWSLNTTAAGTVDSKTGIFTATAAGTAILKATSGAVTGTANLTVTAVPPPGGSACASVVLSGASFYSGASQANWTIGVTAPSTTCTWTAVSDSPWLVVTSTVPSPPVGSGSVRARTLTNETAVSRTGHLTIGGVVYTVQQEKGTATADVVKPIVSFVAPPPGATVAGLVNVSVSASDNVGVVGVQFKLDAVTVGTEDTALPYGFSWNTTAAANGPHTLTAIARDAAGNSAVANLAVSVANTVTPPSNPPCSAVVLSKTSFYSGAFESNWKVSVTAPSPACTWKVVPDSGWIVVASTTPVPPSGSGSFALRILTNTSGLPRTGHFTIAGTVYLVKQE